MMTNSTDPLANDPVRAAAAKLELLSPETREQVLSRMPAEAAQRIRDYLESLPTKRPHGDFSTDVATRRSLIHETANRIAQQRTDDADRIAQELDPRGKQPSEPVIVDPLATLRELHPAAVARAMQGERAEAWSIVLDRLDLPARTALLRYLDDPARAAIDDARTRQSELARTAPALIDTIIAAIARTVVPRATREHHQLLSTTPSLTWTSMPA